MLVVRYTRVCALFASLVDVPAAYAWMQRTGDTQSITKVDTAAGYSLTTLQA